MKQGKIIIEKTVSGLLVYLYRNVDKQKQLLNNITNIEDWTKLNNIECDYFKKGKQLIIKVKGKEIYDSRKSANAPVVLRKPTSKTYTNTKIKLDDDIYKTPKTKKSYPDSLDFSKVKGPKELKSINKDLLIDNFALKLNKCARWDYKDNKEKEKHFTFFNSSSIKKSKKNGGKIVVPTFQIKTNFGNFPFNEFLQKQKKQAELITPNPKCWSQATDGRLVVGLGGTSVYETSMTLHHIYGIPYIPASSIKGVLRSWILINCFDGMNDPNAEERAMKDNVFAGIFGTDDNASDSKAHRGNLIFFDAFPIKAPTIEADIMTPHYSKWYSEGEAPSDTQKLTPIPFLTVAEGTEFQFIVGKKGNKGLLNKPFRDKTIIEWLKEALSEHGIGAKTAVGYGYFNEIE